MRKILIALAAMVLVISLASVTQADQDDSNRGFLGVTLHSTELMDQHGRHSSGESGLFVSEVLPGGAAEAAGLQARDKIVAIDGTDVADLESLKEAMQSMRKGEHVSVTVERDGRERSFDLELGDLPKKLHAHVERFGMAVGHSENRAFVGIETQAVGPQLARYFGVEGGILVENVIEGTPAQDAGIEAGDVITAWGDTPLRKVHDLHAAIADAKPGDRIELGVSRRGAESTILVTFGESGDMLRKHHEMHHGEHEGDMHFDEDHNRRFEVKVIEKKSGGE